MALKESYPQQALFEGFHWNTHLVADGIRLETSSRLPPPMPVISLIADKQPAAFPLVSTLNSDDEAAPVRFLNAKSPWPQSVLHSRCMRPCNPDDLFGQAKHQAASKHPNPGSLSVHPATCFWSKQPFPGFSFLFPLFDLTHVRQEQTCFSRMCRRTSNTVFQQKIMPY